MSVFYDANHGEKNFTDAMSEIRGLYQEVHGSMERFNKELTDPERDFDRVWGILDDMLQSRRTSDEAAGAKTDMAEAVTTGRQSAGPVLSDAQKLQRGVNQVGGGMPTDTTKSTKVAHEMILRNGVNVAKSPSLALLMTVGGALALLGGMEPRLEDATTEESPLVNPNNQYMLHAEMPGRTNLHAPIFAGQEGPFKLKLSITGLVDTEDEKEKVVREVFDTVTGQMQFKNVTTKIQDDRRRNHRRAASDILDRQF